MKKILKTVFGYDNFRYGQKEIVENILKGKDIMALMPTGAGKSICYQLPAVMSKGITLVISPLISLMADQVKNLIQLGIRGAYLNSTLSYRQYLKAIDNAKKGVYKIIYVAPERLETKEFIEFAKSVDISIVSIDEAHCVSQWGQDFRPSYLKIKNFIECLPKRPVLAAFTATATREVKKDIIDMLGLNLPFIMETGFDRSNLYFETRQPENRKTELLKILENHTDESSIIYCISRKNVEEVCQHLCDRGYSATRYHAGLEDAERKRNQDDFIYDRKKIMVATNAFGMGIDKSDVRLVVHYNMPKSLEYYYQEAGRAGRDGEKSECILFYKIKDYYTNQFLIDNIDENGDMADEQRESVIANERKKLNQMKYYATSDRCLRNYMLYYFGEKSTDRCNNCSNCLKTEEIIVRSNRNVDYNLVNALKKLRKELAVKNRIPAATLFTDATIRDMAVKRPVTKAQMADVEGMNSYKMRRYGEDFIKLIYDYEKGNL